ncbi:MAG TPA: DUF3103 family protein, partial [Kribbellaceae bacterium]
VVDWWHFRYDAVSLVMMEQDGTDYQELLTAVVTAIGTIVDFALPYINGLASLVANIVNTIIRALPDSWFIDDDDFADAWYIVTRNGNGIQRGVTRDSWLSLNRHDIIDGVDVAAPLGGVPTVTQSYIIESELTANKVLDTAGEGPLVQWTLNGGMRQQWKVQDGGAGTINLVSLDNGRCLQVKDGATLEGAAIDVATCTGAAGQKWRFVKSGSDVYTLRHVPSGRVLSVKDGSTAEGVGLVLAGDHNFLSQHWRFIRFLK